MSLYPHVFHEHGDFSIFLMGNSNTGKTTLFNELTGAREKVGNRSGMTVELCRETFSFQGKSRVWVADMPGLYSMSVRSTDEEVVLSAFLDQTPDVIVNVVDASNLERNLYLTLQLLEMRIPMLMVLKMDDLAQMTGIQLNLRQLATCLGIPILTSDQKNGLHTETIKQKIVDVYQTGATSLTSTSGYWKIRQLARTILAVEQILAEELYHHVGHDSVHFSIEGMAVRFLEKDTFFIQKILDKYPFLREVEEKIARQIELLEKDLGEASEIIIAENRYQGITEICKQVIHTNTLPERNSRYDVTDRLDAVLANPVWGIPIFVFLMYVLFYLTFHLGSWPVQGLQGLCRNLQESVHTVLGEGFLGSLLADGLIGGVGGILVFLPNILLLFFFISLLEATGYMSRVAFLMDLVMQKLCGVQGKAIIPLVLGFGCNVPAILATRSMESQRSRWITISILPLISCGARLPIYTLLTSVFFDLKWQPLVILGIYLLGIALAVVGAKILAFFWKNPVKETILVELPPYRWPPMKNVFFQVADYTGHFLLRAGTFILAASILLWGLSTFPVKKDFSQDYSAAMATISQDPSLSPEVRREKIRSLKMASETERYDYTCAGRIGSGLEPVFKPLGFDKKIILSLLGAIASKELFVSQMQMLYFFEDSEGQAAFHPLRNAYTPLQSLCVMVFCLIGIPCIGTVAVVRQETGSWKWAIAQWCCLTFLAWFLTFCLFQIGSRWYS